MAVSVLTTVVKSNVKYESIYNIVVAAWGTQKKIQLQSPSS